MLMFFGIVSFLLFLSALIITINPKWISKGDKQYSRKDTLKVAGICFVLFVVFATVDGSKNPPTTNTANTANTVQEAKSSATQPVTEQASSNVDVLNFRGDMKLQVSGNKIITTINSNVPDGGLFEVTIMDGKLNVASEIIPIKGGKIVKEFPIPKKWGVGYVAGLSAFRFNLEKNPQPATIKKIYGDKGEKMTGELTATNNLGGKNGALKAESVAYPDEATVKAEQMKLFNKAINEMIKASNGIVVDIAPRYEGKWDMVNVVVSDSWYNSQDYEKERFADTVGGAVEKLVIDAGLAKDIASVYFVDTYGKDVATPKMLGGYDIEK